MTSTALPPTSSPSPIMAEGSSTLGGGVVATARAGEANVLGPILDMGSSGVRRGLVIGIALAFVVHGYLVARVAMALIDMGHFVRDAREEAHAYFWATYDIETDKKEEPKQEKEEPEPEPVPDPEPEPDIVQKPVPKEDIYQQAAARPAAAPDLVTSKEDSQAPEDFYGVVDHDGSTGPIHGKVANNGQGDTPVDPSKRTSPTGNGSGNGSGKVDSPPPKKVDLSRPATLVGSTSWSCPFPPEADAEGRDSAVAVIVVTVRPDGTPQSVSVVQDPGAGFGRAARKCALGRRYDAGLDKDGQKTTTTTPPIRVKFSR